MKTNRVLVIGDDIQDVYITYKSYRNSPDSHAYCPILVEPETEIIPGGANNVCTNIRAMGGEAIMICNGLSIKTRIMHGQHSLCRIDQDNQKLMDLTCLVQTMNSHIQNCDVVVLSDYGKGVITDPQPLIKLACKYKKPVIVDPKKSNWSLYNGATLIKPNQSEYATANTKCSISNILVSKGSEGMELIKQDSQRTYYIKGIKTSVIESTGCGDTVIACLATYWGQMSLFELANLANKAGSLAVSKPHTAVITRMELEI